MACAVDTITTQWDNIGRKEIWWIVCRTQPKQIKESQALEYSVLCLDSQNTKKWGCTYGFRILAVMLKSYCHKQSSAFALMVQQTICPIKCHLLSHRLHEICTMCRNAIVLLFHLGLLMPTGDLALHRSNVNGCGYLKHCNRLNKQCYSKHIWWHKYIIFNMHSEIFWWFRLCQWDNECELHQYKKFLVNAILFLYVPSLVYTRKW